MKKKLTNRLVALLLSAFTVISALPVLGLGMTVWAADKSTTTATSTSTDGEFLRIFHLDCGRKYFSVDEIKGMIDQLSANYYTHLQLAFGNDGFRFLLDDMSVGDYSSDAVKNAITTANNSYSSSKDTSSSVLTQSDMDEITAYATSKGIEVIPLLNTPGHMTVLLNAMKTLDNSISSEMNTNQGSGSYFDPSGCPSAASFAQALVSKYAEYFAGKGSKYFNIATDECGFTSMNTTKYTAFAEYVNSLNAIVKANGMTAMVFNDGICRTDLTTNTAIDTDILVCYWTDGTGLASTEALAEAGYKIINTNNSWYYVLGDYLYDVWSSGQWGYKDSLNGLKTVSATTLKDGGNVTPVGSMLCVWCDGPKKDYSSSKDNVYSLIQTMAEQNPTYFKAAELPDIPAQTLTDAASGITVTVKPSGTATEYVYSISIEISVTYTSAKTAKVTVSVTITENDQPYTKGATLTIPYDTWNEYLSESGFGIENIIDLVASVSGDSVDIKRDDDGKQLVLTVPHFSDVEIDATIANASEVPLNTKEIILDIGGTETITLDGVYIDNTNPTFNPTGIASVKVDSVQGTPESTTTTTAYNQDFNVTCAGLVTSSNWTKIDGYYYKDGDNYYQFWAKRQQGSGFGAVTYTYTWGYKSNDSQSTPTEISTQQVAIWSSDTKPDITVYTKTETTVTTPGTKDKTTLTFTAISGGTTKVTIGDTEYTVKVRRAPVKVTVNCVCGGKTIYTTTVDAKDNLSGGYTYTLSAPTVSGYTYSSGALNGTVEGATTVTLIYSEKTFEVADSITLPISIIDYRSDGLLFDYNYSKDNSYAYSLVHSYSNPTHGTDNNRGTAYGYSIDGTNMGTHIANTRLEIANRYSSDITSSGNSVGWCSGNYLNSGWIRTGMVEDTLGANGLPVYTSDTIYAVANLLRQGIYNSGVTTSSKNANKEFINTFLSTNAARSVLASTTPTAMSESFAKAQTYDNITNAYDLAWWLLNNLYTADSNYVTDSGKTVPIYGMATNTYKGIVLKKVGNVYVYDSAYATTYDKENGYIYNTDTPGAIITNKSQATNRFWPIDGEGYESSEYYGEGETSWYTKDGAQQNGNFTLVGTAQFIYKTDDYFYFSGDDDVYLYINGRLAVDLGGAHGVCYKEINLSELGEEYGLVEGQPATFTFFYMERCSDNSNFSMRTNIDLTVPSMTVEKNAYTENGDKLIDSGTAVPSYSDVIYDFVVRNTGNADLTNIVLKDDDGSFGNTVYFGGGTNRTGSGNAKLDLSGPFTVWFESDPDNKTVYSTYADVTAAIANITLEIGDALHVKGLRGKFTPNINTVFTYENALTVTAKAGDKNLSASATHKLYSFNIGDTTAAYVVDFGLPMTVKRVFDESFNAVDYIKNVTLASSGKYGTAALVQGKDYNELGLVYTLTSPINGSETVVLDVELEIGGTKIKTKKHITIIPATSVYYEDSFGSFITFETVGGCTWTVDGTTESKEQSADRIGLSENVYGYDQAYDAMSKFSLGSAHKVTVSGSNYATAKFSFFGTGFDIISATTNTSGTIVVSVTSKDGSYSKNFLVDTYYGYTKDSEGNWIAAPDTAAALWQIPVMKVTGLDYGEYDVTVTAAYADFFSHGQNGGGSYDFWFDAVRIYDPAGAVAGSAGDSQASFDKAYKADGEGWPTYTELRDMIIDENSFNPDNTEGVNGAIFIDGQSGNVSIADYTNYGPNNELYLAKGQAIAFKLDTDENVADIQIAIKNILSDKNAHCIIKEAGSNTNLFDSDIKTATDMYHSIKALSGKTVVIMNTGDGILSVTNLKVTYTANPNAAAEVDAFSITVDGSVALAAVSAVDEVLNPKTPFEPGKVEIKTDVDKRDGTTDVTVITTPDVEEVEIDGEKVTDYTVDPVTGNRIWKKRFDRELIIDPEISVIVTDKNGNTSAPVTATVVSGGSFGSLIGGFIGKLIKNIFSALFG